MRAWTNLKRALEAIFDAVIPPQARTTRTRSRTINELPLKISGRDALGSQITSLLDYRDEIVQDLIHSLKYDASSHAAALASSLIADYLCEEIASIRLFSKEKILLVPMPLHKSRIRKRGFNQMDIVMNALPKEYRDGTLSVLAPQALVRVRATPHQTKLKRAERIKNIAGAFACPMPLAVKNAHIFLIDDVTTTGATLKSASEPLIEAGAKVTLLALARA